MKHKTGRSPGLFDDSKELPSVNVIDRYADMNWDRWFTGPTRAGWSDTDWYKRVQLLGRKDSDWVVKIRY